MDAIVGEKGSGEAMAFRGKFWAGMRVLAIDNNLDSLKDLVDTLRQCDYNVTPVVDAKTALKTLWEAKDPFELVISEADMPDIDGIDLLRYIAFQTNIPVIVVSANGNTETVMKGIKYGVCDYLMKPVRVEQLWNIWQHVVRRKPEAWNDDDDDDANRRVGIAEGDPGPKSNSWKNSNEKRIVDEDDSDDNMGLKSSKKPRVIWTPELHAKFLEAFNSLGKDAVPKKICEMLDVDYIDRLSVASHLQKYRAYLRRTSDPKTRELERWNSPFESFRQYNEHRIRRPSSVFPSSSSNNPVTTRPIQPRKNLGKRTVKQGARSRKSKGHAKALCGLLLKTNQGKACSDLDYSFENKQDEEMPHPVSQFPVQPPELVNQSSVIMNTAPAFFQKQDAPATNLVGAIGDASKFPNLFENCNNSWQTALPSMFPGLSQANIADISQLTSFAGASSSPMPMVTTEELSNPMASFNQQMPPFNIESNTSSVGMLNGNFEPGSTSSSMNELTEMVNGLSINSTLPEVETDDNFFEWMLNYGEDAADTLPVQEGTGHQQALDVPLSDSNDYISLDEFIRQHALDPAVLEEMLRETCS